MTLEQRMNGARVESYQFRSQYKRLRLQSLQLRQELREQLVELRVARMKQAILLAKLRRTCLLNKRISPVRGAGIEFTRLPIQ